MKIVTVSDPDTGAATRPGITMCPPPDLRKPMVVRFGDWEMVIEDPELKLAILALPHSFRAIDTWNKRHPSED